MAVIVDQISIVIGSPPSSTISNIESIAWRVTPEDNIRPVVVMNQIAPVSWYKSHSWVEIELEVKSEAHASLNGLVGSPVNMTIKMIDNAQVEWTVSFTSAICKTRGHAARHGGDLLERWTFLAQSVSVTHS